jgi:hypothetical protein
LVVFIALLPALIINFLASNVLEFAATNRRARQAQQEFKTTRRRNSTLTATRTFRRGSQYQEIQVAALPDLSENLINESQTWEEIREIKAMPVPMAQKRELKNQLQVSKSFAEVSMLLLTTTALDVQAKNSHGFSYCWQRFFSDV